MSAENQPVKTNAPQIQLADLLQNGSLASAVWTTAVGYRDEAPESLRDSFNINVLHYMRRARLPMGGARDESGLKTALLRRNTRDFISAVRTGSRVGFSSAALWAHQNADLHAAALRFATSKGLAVSPAEILAQDTGRQPPRRWPARWLPHHLDELATELATLSGASVDNARLMLFMICLAPTPSTRETQQKPQSEPTPQLDLATEEPAPTAPLTAPLLTSFLSAVEALDDDAPEWTQLPSLIGSLGVLAARRDERRSQGVSRLAAALRRFQDPEVQKGLVRLPKLQGHEEWATAAFAPSTAGTVAEQLEALVPLIVELEDLFNQPSSSALTVDDIAIVQQRLHRILALQGEVTRGYERIAGLIRLPPRPEQEPLESAPSPSSTEISGPEEPQPSVPALASDNTGEEALILPAPTIEIVRADEKPSTVPAPLSASLVETEVATAPVLPPTAATTPTNVVPVAVSDPVAPPKPEELSSAPLSPVSAMETALAPVRASEELAGVTARTVRGINRRMAAEALLHEPSKATQAAFLYALVADGDVAGAYWLARALEANGLPASVPSWLLAALAASSKLSEDGSLLAAGIQDIVANAPPLPADQQLHELALAAALPSVLRSPASGLMGWLVVPPGALYLAKVVETIQGFASYGQAIPDNLQEVLGTEAERAERLAAASSEAARWTETAPSKRTGYGPANAVWRELLRSSVFASLLHTAARDERNALKEMRENLDRLTVPGAVALLVDQISRRHSRDGKPINGAAATWLTTQIEEGLSRVQDWLYVAELDERMRSQGDWILNQLHKLQQELAVALPIAIDGFDNHAHDGTAATVAAHTALRRTFHALDTMLSCGCRIAPPEVPADVQLHVRLLEGGRNLNGLLARRLLTIPGLRLPSGSSSGGAELESLVRELPRQVITPPSIASCLEGWIKQEDFRFTSSLIDAVDDASQRQHLTERVSVALEGSRRRLKSAVQQTREEVERAFVDGIIEDRARLTGRLEGLYEDGLREFQSPQRVLEEVNRELKVARDEKVSTQRERWTTLKVQLASVSFDVQERQRAIARIEELLGESDYANADLLLAELTQCLDSQRTPDSTLFTPTGERPRHFESFLKVLPSLEQELKHISGRETPKRAQEIFARELEHAESRRDVKGLYEQWGKLTATRGKSDESLHSAAAVLASLGFKATSERMSRAVRTDGRVTVLELAVSSTGASPVPHFGSRVDYRLRVHCSGTPAVPRPMAAVEALPPADGEGALVLYAGRLSLSERRQLSDACRVAGHAVIVIDEWLLLYLAGLPEGERLHALFACALPFSAINPYSERASASVPREMFFGREEMVSELASLTGTCLVYGGRQLGKSALLEQVERRFKSLGGTELSSGKVSHRTHNAIRLNIKHLGDPASLKPPEALWVLLAEELKRIGFLPKTQTAKPETLIGHITDYLAGERPCQLLILLDEADNFLDADAKSDFQQVKRLSDLMTKNPNRCKVVLAGLHNVQRFQGIPNQPLAHFGRALLVGPLEARYADQLVRKPLEALGFRFPPEEKNAAVLRILSYTNYHPGLIQLFCRDLVTTLLRRGSPHHQPPYTIRVADVEEAYRKEDTRRLIRERFEWTLALDPRYQAIAWSLIVHSDDAADVYARPFSVDDILTQVSTFWPQGFSGVDQEQMRALLDEMEGLGVLARDARGAYRMRSPNVVRLLGHIDTIWERLGELEKKEFTGTFHVDYHHVKLDEERPPHFSPFTYAQGRQLCEPSSHVSLILGSRATHLDDLPSALDKLADRRESNALQACAPLPGEALSTGRLSDWVLAHMADTKASGGSLYWAELTPEQARDGRLVDEAVRLCSEPKWKAKRWLRIVLTMRPAAAWNWMVSACVERPERIDVRTMRLLRWTQPAVDRLFEELDLRSEEVFHRRVLTATTGGWPMLLRDYATQALHLLSRGGRHQDGRRAADDLEQALARGAPKARDFWRALELDALPRVEAVLRFVRDIEGIPFGTNLEEFLDGDTSALVGQSDRLLRLLLSYGCLELKDTKLGVERLVAEALPK